MASYSDYPQERVSAEHDNSKMVCFFCKRPVNEIKDTLAGHAPDCTYRLQKEGKK